MVKLISALGCALTAFAGGFVVRVAPMNDPYMWLVIFLFGCSFACFWAELFRP